MHGLPEHTMRQAACFRILRWAVFVVLGLQVIVGQALAISGARVMNPQATAAANMFGKPAAEVVAWSIGIATIIAAAGNKGRFWGALAYTGYTVLLIAGIWHVDPFVAGLYCIYSLLGVVLMAVNRVPKERP